MGTPLKIPENYQAVMLYLILKDAQKFIDFTTRVFEASLTHKAMRDPHHIQHGEVMIGGTTIMFADATETYAERPAGMFVYVLDVDKTFKQALEEGGTVVSSVSDQPYGRSGGISDPCGNTWWITSPK